LRKKKLDSLDIESFPAVVETSQLPADEEKIKHIFTAKKHQNLLVVTFFSLETSAADFRVFFDRKTFITQHLTENRKWSTATLDWFCDWHICGTAVCANERSARRIYTFFRADSTIPPFNCMRDFQREIRKRRLAAKHKRETDKIDERMKIVGKLPKDFNYWLNEVALDFSRYIYYKRQSKRLITGFCTSCQNSVEFRVSKKMPHENVRHNQTGKCPVCKKSITFKATGRTTLLSDTTTAAFIQKTPTGFLVRSFSVTKRYNSHYQNPQLEITELVRDFYDGVDLASFEYTYFKSRKNQNIRWCHSKHFFQLDYACLYTRNVRRALADTVLKYCCVYELAKNVVKFNIWRYFNAYYTFPAYEYLIKLRLYRFVVENVYMSKNDAELNFDGKDCLSILGINRTQLQQMQRLNGGIKHYKLIKAIGETGVTLKDEQVETFLRMELNNDRIVSLLRFVTVHKIISYITRCLEIWQMPRGGQFQSPEMNVAICWDDYLENSAMLGYDMENDFVLFPRDLKARHDEVMVLYKAEKSELLSKTIAALHENLASRFNYTWQGMMVRPPVSMDEIVADGHKLRHCVGSGSYIENMAKGKCFILFVRRAECPSEPFFTIELRDNMVIQCRGQKNCSMTDEVKKFVAQWQKQILKQSQKSLSSR